jgi:NAD(P)H dehydrogenase (quinone)
MMNKEILVLYASFYGNTEQMARFICQGIEQVKGVGARLRTVPRLSQVTEKVEPSIPDKGPAYVEKKDFIECIGLALGSPTRFGNMAASLKYVLDQTGDLWMSQALVDKPACVFTSTGSVHGGQEATLLSMQVPLMHHGMVIVGLPYVHPALMKTKTGGTPYGPSHVAGEKADYPIDQDERALCLEMGHRLAQMALKLVG